MNSFKHLFFAFLFTVFFFSCKNAENTTDDYTQYVNPFIGTAENGHCFPGASMPFGLIQASPVTGNCSWTYCAGYQYEDIYLYGFSQIHINGTGCTDLGDILLLPFSDVTDLTDFASRIDKKKEEAHPGYYQVYLSDSKANAEITCSERVAFHKYTYDKGASPKLLVDLQFGTVTDSASLHKHVLESETNIESNNIISGHARTSHWVDRNYYFVIEFNKPFVRKSVLAKRHKDEKADRFILEFDLSDSEPLLTKIALSTVSVENAKLNMETEISDWNFEDIRKSADNRWNEYLSRVDIEGSIEEKENFYTAMYHLFLQPSNIADVNGDYRGADNKTYNSATKAYYSTFSLWDTYRAAHPLYTILLQEKVDDFVLSMLAHHKAQGYLPIWTLWGKENHCMIGNHAVPVIVDAYLKGFRGFDAEEAFNAINTSLTENHFNSEWDVYTKYGYYPFDLIKNESVSKTLESVYDDYCAAQFAKALGKTKEYEYFLHRSNFYKNLFDEETKLMRGKDSKGNWRTPFNSFLLSHAGTAGGDYTEGNAWQYTWHIQHDVEGLIKLMGGKEYFATKLDSLFFLDAVAENTGFVLDVTGLIGQYAHGNEPSHHVAYLYNYAGQPWKTQELVREVFDRFYLNKPDGLCGNDDCGQMSAWYIFSAMGFYPVNPAGGEYVLGAPQIEKISLSLPQGKIFTVHAKNLSKENKYVDSIYLNGQVLQGFTIHHKDIMAGGELIFTMTDKPSKKQKTD